MNGDSRETGKLTPDGKPDPSVFSTRIQPRGHPRRHGGVRGRSQRGTSKEADHPLSRLVGRRQTSPICWQVSTRSGSTPAYATAKPRPENRHSFRPETVSSEYTSWPRVVDLCALPPSNGLMEKRGGALIDIDREALAERMKAYFNKQYDWQQYGMVARALTAEQARFDPKRCPRKGVGRRVVFRGSDRSLCTAALGNAMVLLHRRPTGLE